MTNLIKKYNIEFKKRYIVRIEKEYEAYSEDQARDMFLEEAHYLAKYHAESEKISDINF